MVEYGKSKSPWPCSLDWFIFYLHAQGVEPKAQEAEAEMQPVACARGLPEAPISAACRSEVYNVEPLPGPIPKNVMTDLKTALNFESGLAAIAGVCPACQRPVDEEPWGAWRDFAHQAGEGLHHQ